jgi:uncharacterized spore protein YtfJ
MDGDLPDGFTQVSEWLQHAPTVETVYGDPVERDGRTVVPVARVAYRALGGFGWGSGSGAADAGEGESSGGGGGGRGGAEVTPVGALEIGDDGTEFVRFEADGGWRRVLVVGLLGVALGVLLGRGRRAD